MMIEDLNRERKGWRFNNVSTAVMAGVESKFAFLKHGKKDKKMT